MASSSSVTSINGYNLQGELQNANSGFSKWGFAVKDSHEYFIKELITPIYPMDTAAMSESLFAKKRKECEDFENRYKNFYNAINNASGGLLVRINDFFRFNSRYYVVTEKVNGTGLSMQDIANMPERKKLILMLTAARGFYYLHNAGIVHFDVKPSNILIQYSDNGNPVAKLIDFDAGFFINESMNGKELGGDLTYLAPETFFGISGEATSINGKADIFALGLVFHEYFCGCLPTFDHNEYEYPYESVLDDKPLGVMRDRMPAEIADIISAMLDAQPENRPTTDDIIVCIYGLLNPGATVVMHKDEVEEKKSDTSSVGTSTKSDGWFTAAGDL